MAIIDPDGLFNGDRLRRCSNMARLYWPYFFLMSNGYGRLEINLPRIAERYFSSFNPPVTAQDLEKFILEYHAAHLLFLYEAPDGQLWGQWDTDPVLLKKYKTEKDKKSPSPPEDEYKAWISEYISQEKLNSENFKRLLGNIPKLQKVSANLPLGVGVGVGIGEGIGLGDGIGVGEFNPTEAARYITNELNLSGQQMMWLCTDATEKCAKHYNLTNKLAAETIVSHWREYETEPGDFKVGIKRFLEEGKYIRVKPKSTEADFRGADVEDFRELAVRLGTKGGNAK